MKFKVEISPDAMAELESAYQWLAERTPLHAPDWYNDALDAILSLGEFPERCPHDSRELGTRQLLFGNKHHTYRIIFRIVGETVRILHIRHAARDE